MTKLCIALDVDVYAEARHLVEQTKDYADCYKIGYQYYLSQGYGIAFDIMGMDREVFLDLKLHDIPNTVANAVTSFVNRGFHYTTLHIAGGSAMLAESANRVRARAAELNVVPPKLLGVTLLTSIDESLLKKELGVAAKPSAYVVKLARMGLEAGLDGLVLSPNELVAVKAELGDMLDGKFLVTPGIRPLGADQDDQARTATPENAMNNGASMVVVGRPVIAAEKPSEAAKAIKDALMTVAIPEKGSTTSSILGEALD